MPRPAAQLIGHFFAPFQPRTQSTKFQNGGPVLLRQKRIPRGIRLFLRGIYNQSADSEVDSPLKEFRGHVTDVLRRKTFLQILEQKERPSESNGSSRTSVCGPMRRQLA